PYDAGGRRAAGGRFDEAMMAELLEDPYFTQEPPKSTGREYFGQAYAEGIVTRCREAFRNSKPEDVLATGAMLTVLSVYQAYARFIRPRHELDALIVSGGGRHNDFLMERLKNTFAPIPVRTVDEFGLDSDAKEALCFAVLAHEPITGAPTNMPSVPGASHRTLLGKICVPPWGRDNQATKAHMSSGSEFTPSSTIGEFGLIDRLRGILGEPGDDDLVAGISDDAAVYRIGEGRVHIVTSDMLVEGVHFDRLTMPMEYLGTKSIADRKSVV